MFKSKIARVIAGLTGVIGSIGAIVGILTKVFDWDTNLTTEAVTLVFFAVFVAGYFIDKLVSKINDNINSRLDEIEQKLIVGEEEAKKRYLEQQKAICRLELSQMIARRPRNKLAIERKAKHYFCDLGGNDWMGDVYSKWANKYDGDISILMCDNKGREKK